MKGLDVRAVLGLNLATLSRVHTGAGQSQQELQFNLIDTLSVGVDRIQRNFEPMQRQVESWRQTQITAAQAKLIFYSAFVDGKRDAAKSLTTRGPPHVFRTAVSGVFVANQLQVLGAGCLLNIVLTHLCQALQLFPWMRWGSEHSVGHYLDLVSGVLSLTLFPIGYLLHELAKRHA